MSDGKDMRQKEIQEYRERLKEIVKKMRQQKTEASNDMQRYMEQIDIIRKELQEKLQHQRQKIERDVIPEIKNNGESEIKKEIKKRVEERNKRIEEMKGKLRGKSGISNDEQKIGIMQNPQPCCND